MSNIIEILAGGIIQGETEWGAITGTLSSQTDLQSALDAKQNILVSTENIKSINGESILGTGNLVVAGGGGGANLAYTASPTQGIVASDTGTDATIPAGSATNASLMLPADKTKLDGVASGATANATDAQLRDRSTHTGTQAISTVTGLQTALDGKQPTGDYATNTALTNGLVTKENTITAGTTAQYFRGDKTFQTLDKTAVGLSNVDNTSDLNKPISTATQTALNAKQNTITTGTISQYFRGDLSLATLDKTAVGLANVDNTSDANKPVSTATQTALNGKISSDVTGITGADAITNTVSLTTAEYTAIGTKNVSTLYIITDAT